MDMSTKTEKVNLYMASDTASMLEAAAIKLRCSKSAVVEALIRIECGLSADDPVALWFKHHGMKPTQTDYSKLTEADVAAKRPRGARVSRPILDSLDADDLAAAKEAKARIDAAAKRRADDEAMERKHRARNGRPAAKSKPRANTPSPKILITGPGATQISEPKAHSVNITHNYDPKAGKKA